RITNGDFSVTDFDLSDDGRKIVYHAAPTPLLGDGDKGDVWIANADGSSPTQLTKNAVAETGAAISPDGSQALWSRDGKSIYFTANLGVHGEAFVVPAGGGKAKQLTDGKHNVAGWSQGG